MLVRMRVDAYTVVGLNQITIKTVYSTGCFSDTYPHTFTRSLSKNLVFNNIESNLFNKNANNLII